MSTGIAWTEATWNPTTGCDRVSAGCEHCYAATMAKRLKAMGSAKYQHDGDPRTSGPGFGLAVHHGVLDEPLRWARPRQVFVNSMSDLFHQQVPDGFIGSVWNTMARAEQHTFQVLTKRHARARSLLNRWAAQGWYWRDHLARWCGPVDGPLRNVWLGVSAEDQRWADLRVPALAATPAAVRFVSAEPLLGPLDLSPYLDEVDWVIAGGESGPGARACDPDWIISLAEQCARTDTALFVKQLGSVWARRAGAASSKGTDPAEWPEHLQLQQQP